MISDDDRINYTADDVVLELVSDAVNWRKQVQIGQNCGRSPVEKPGLGWVRDYMKWLEERYGKTEDH